MKSLGIEKRGNLVPQLFEVWNEFGGNAASGHGALDGGAVVNGRFKALHFEARLLGGLGTDALHLVPVKFGLLGHVATIRLGLVHEYGNLRNREWLNPHLEGV